MQERVAIITVLYNSSSVLPDFFRSLEGQTRRDFTLYAVDNASPDDSLEQVQAWAGRVSFPVEVIRSETNAGIAAGNNRGIRAAREAGCRWFLLTNNDTVWEPDTLEILLAEAERHGAGMAVPKITIHGTDRLWYAGGSWNRLRGGTRHHGLGRRDRATRDEASRPVEYAPTCCMLIRDTVFERVGVMDERFFLYYDDADFVRRATRAGETLWYVPRSCLAHKESVSTGGVSPLAQYWLSRNLLLFTRKHYSAPYWCYVLAVHWAILLTKRAITFDRAQWTACRRGILDGIEICRTPVRKISTEIGCTE
ncbi:MAG: glycosyltransferase family 2 protein [Rikenellaceae bacterium]|jgi:GT2 family glycosyltransferase|nr:glycosyltransferase family 2 protein [Rikenellaceae bacterium]